MSPALTSFMERTMKTENESLSGCQEHILAAIELLGLSAMGIDADCTRREAMDQLAMALSNLKTGQENIRTAGVQGKNQSNPAPTERKPAPKEKTSDIYGTN